MSFAFDPYAVLAEIRNRRGAPATPATPATENHQKPETVASVATVAAPAAHFDGREDHAATRSGESTNVIPLPVRGPLAPAERTCCTCGAGRAAFGLGPPGGARRWPEERRATWWHCGGSGCESAALAAWRAHYGLGTGDNG